ncbi:23S rRNA (guanosine(2251)-2'-O)-methyltransferase RlmB [Acetohalobium arabaticum]|uniref:RNA methyltransferase, TrmH family, group 3 n=1 Tax=Acetohalobium arabaticum (strain ATCC 49924 / DSM 5501 / Z-7288) TaxID=574087 RepID=D9QTD1_ACEAZ|nr:23S rRNA (guanosine(2251)-2'-O)-methyltransferase RlmB [Acetohalobium arabaticum]ADL11695.1 RNA methyltransferase, TrmH family, group 3 [Acetohalobium arabaticum DSM 5501]
MKKIEGRNPVMEALKSERRIDEILIYQNAEGVNELLKKAKAEGIKLKRVAKEKLDNLADSYSHQGVIAFGEPIKYLSLDQLIDKAYNKTDDPLFILLDEIKDPHNFGSILRTADAVGAQGVIIPKRRSVGLTSAVGKASAGAIEHIPVAQVTNLVRAMEELKENRFWIAGADMEAEGFCYQQDLTGPLGIVIGSEGAGMRRLVKERCDFLIKLPMKGRINSLNAAVAGAVLMYEALRQRNYSD